MISRHHRLALCLFIASLSLATTFGQERPLPDFDVFAAEVRKRLATDETLQSGYVFNERRVQQRVNGEGRVTDESVKVYEIHPGLPGEGRYLRLIEEDGRPTSPSKLAKGDVSRQQKAEEYARKQTVASEQEKRARQQDKARREYSSAVDDVFRIYDIRMLGRERIEGHDTIVASLTPKPNAKPATDDGKIMRKFKARAWISESDYELVRAEIEAVENLAFGLGLLARVHKGTVATYERRKVNDEVWLPAKVTWTASARVLLLKRLRLRGISEFSSYRKYSVDTSTTIAQPQ